MDYTIGVGTVGAGLWVSYNSGGKFRHIFKGAEPEVNCRALAVSPHTPGVILAAQDRIGVIRSEDNGGSWQRIGNRIDSDIWCLAFDPHDPQRIYVGARPGVWASDDGGESFAPLETSISDVCPIGVPRTTNIIVDPDEPNRVWASVEVNGLHVSEDRGKTWSQLPNLGPAEFYDDVHGFTVRQTTKGLELLATSPFGFAKSQDLGQTWNWHEFGGFEGSKMEYAYCRCVREPWADGTVIVCAGDYIPGQVGALEVSRDAGDTWQRADLPATPNSTMYWLASHPEVPGVCVASSVFGQVYVTDDHAESWRKLDREFGEIRALSLTPA